MTSPRSRIAALAGGVGAARLLRGMIEVVPASEITAIVNTGDDTVLHGLHISPDLDTVMYTLAGVIDEETGWGRADESWTVMEGLDRLGGEAWFRLGDRDLATHLFRTQRLADGLPLHAVTAELCRSFGLSVQLVPVTDDAVRTRLTVADGTEIAFQDYFVRLRHGVPVTAVRFDGAASAVPAPGVLDALVAADAVIVCPSNPIVSIGPVLAVPGVREVLAGRRESVAGVSPIVAGAAIKGPADRLMAELGSEPSVVGIARAYADMMGTLVIDQADAELAGAVEAEGVRCVAAPTVMTTVDVAEQLSRTLLGTVGVAAGTGGAPG